MPDTDSISKVRLKAGQVPNNRWDDLVRAAQSLPPEFRWVDVSSVQQNEHGRSRIYALCGPETAPFIIALPELYNLMIQALRYASPDTIRASAQRAADLCGVKIDDPLNELGVGEPLVVDVVPAPDQTVHLGNIDSSDAGG